MISLNHPHLSQGASRAGNVLGSFQSCHLLQNTNRKYNVYKKAKRVSCFCYEKCADYSV